MECFFFDNEMECFLWYHEVICLISCGCELFYINKWSSNIQGPNYLFLLNTKVSVVLNYLSLGPPNYPFPLTFLPFSYYISVIGQGPKRITIISSLGPISYKYTIEFGHPLIDGTNQDGRVKIWLMTSQLKLFFFFFW